jgi:predicted transcriptional regulator
MDILAFMNQEDRVIIVNPVADIEKLNALASEPRVQILALLNKRECNVNEIAEDLGMPQSTIASHISILEKAGLIRTETVKAKKGNQKRCRPAFEELIIQFPQEQTQTDFLEVEMPIGLFTDYHATAPCGLCAPEGIIGFLDTPETFLNPNRMKAGLLWFGTGFVEYKFPNNALYENRPVKRLEISAEISSETPGTNANWLSDITVWINNIETGTWVSPGDFGDRRGTYTPEWWKLEGSQYGLLKNWGTTEEGTFVDGVKVSSVTIDALSLADHHSIRVRFGVKEDAEHQGGMNLFGRGFGNYPQNIVLRLFF